VQQFGLELLVLADGWAQGKEQTEQLRLALVAAGADPADLFPGAESYEDFDPAQDEGVDFDYSAVDWQDGTTVDDFARMQAALADSRVTVSSKSEEAQDEPGPEVPDVDFDREWQ
jgi:hypothetical protein